MLAIALIPSVVLIGAGVGINAYLLVNAVQQSDTATLLSAGYNMAVPFMPALSEERRASIAMVAEPSPQNRAALDGARHGMDQLLSRFSSISTQVADAMPTDAKTAIGQFVGTMPQIIGMRQKIDSGNASRLQVYAAYNQVADAMITAANAIGHDSTDRDVALERATASELMRMSDWLDRSNALAAAAHADGGLTAQEAAEYNSLTNGYRAEVATLRPELPAADQKKLDQLLSSADWNDLGAVETALVTQSLYPQRVQPPLPVSDQRWQDAVRRSATTLSTMGLGDLGSLAANQEKQSADDAVTRSTIIAAGSLLLAVAVLIVALRIGSDLIRRLRRLRTDTLEAGARLPVVVDRIRHGGEQLDPDAAVPDLYYGTDEVGEVAAAFTEAQRSAVEAAAREARLRKGTNVVFLNIARRSQALVQRQLQVLDRAQRRADDPDQVALLFQLDHLSTRERRNAENLIILGGGQLDKQWHGSVRLIDLIRGAVAETEQYNRVTFKRVQDTQVVAHAVTDVVHLLSELVDNAIEFSPDGSRIEVSSNRVGHGTVVEIEDQGIGIPPRDCDAYNAMFREPPDFGFMALNEASRIGFFVVARLARRHNIRVSLQESSYGGLRAIVLIPTDLTIVEENGTAQSIQPIRGWFDHDAAGVRPPGSAETAPVAADRAPEPVNGRTSVTLGQPTSSPRSPQPFADHEERAPLHERHEPAAEPDTAWQWPQPSVFDDDRPELPRRARQKHLAPQLQDEPADVAEDYFVEPNDNETVATAARHMMNAFQRGTENGRADFDVSDSECGWPR